MLFLWNKLMPKPGVHGSNLCLLAVLLVLQTMKITKFELPQFFFKHKFSPNKKMNLWRQWKSSIYSICLYKYSNSCTFSSFLYVKLLLQVSHIVSSWCHHPEQRIRKKPEPAKLRVHTESGEMHFFQSALWLDAIFHSSRESFRYSPRQNSYTEMWRMRLLRTRLCKESE